MERASSRTASAAAASSALDLGRDLASACAGGELLWLRSRVLMDGKEAYVPRVVCGFGAACRFPFHLSSWAP